VGVRSTGAPVWLNRIRQSEYSSGHRREDWRSRTALPSPNKTGSQELTALFLGETSDRDRIRLQECIEFRDKLEEIAEREEAPIEGPWWPGSHGFDAGYISFAAEEDYALTHCLLARKGGGGDALDCWLRDAVEEAETILKHQRSRGSVKRAKVRTAHGPSPSPAGHLRQG
jgi:hypothetical protein